MFSKISQNSQESTCAIVSFLIKLQVDDCSVIKKETLAQVFSCEFCKIFKNTFFFLQKSSSGCFCHMKQVPRSSEETWLKVHSNKFWLKIKFYYRNEKHAAKINQVETYIPGYEIRFKLPILIGYTRGLNKTYLGYSYDVSRVTLLRSI